MAVTLAKKNNIVSSITISDGFKVKGSKSTYSIRLETWATGDNGNTEVRIVIRDQDGKFHGATNFKQNLALDMAKLLSGKHTNKRK